MKKFLILAVLVSLLSACGSQPPPPPVPAPAAAPASSWGAQLKAETDHCTQYQVYYGTYRATETQWASFCGCYYAVAQTKYPKYEDYYSVGYYQMQSDYTTQQTCLKSSGITP